MRWSKAFIPTLKETPNEAEAKSHILMLRAGLISKLAAGIYTYLPIGFKVLKKVEEIVRRHMDAAGAQEVLMPAMHPKELWEKTGRDKALGEEMYSFKDRTGRDMVLGPTHEEVITDLASHYIKSYKQLPIILYQIQTKFRDEPRPRFGVIRSKEFIMKDAHSFNTDDKDLDKSYKKMHKAYCGIFDECGLDYFVVEADSGFMGGSESAEFMVAADNGEDLFAKCKKCDYITGHGIAETADICPKCSKEIEVKRAIEVGHIFKLGTKYTKVLGASFLDEGGKLNDITMGCYGIGVNRIIASVIEQNNDDNGIIWPKAIAPFEALVVVCNAKHEDSLKAAEGIYAGLKEAGIDVLLDDRDLRAGVKFKDADLIGIPLQIVVGERNLASSKVEIKVRKTAQIKLDRKSVV